MCLTRAASHWYDQCFQSYSKQAVSLGGVLCRVMSLLGQLCEFQWGMMLDAFHHRARSSDQIWGLQQKRYQRRSFLLLLFNAKLSISSYVNFTWTKDQGATLGFAFTAKTYPWINVMQQNLYGYYRRQSAKTDLETRYNGLLGCNYLVILCSSFCCRLCRKTQLVHVMQGV